LAVRAWAALAAQRNCQKEEKEWPRKVTKSHENAREGRRSPMEKAAGVAQASKPAVSPTSKSAEHPNALQGRRLSRNVKYPCAWTDY